MEFPDCKDRLNNDGIGIDLGIKDLAICSDGDTYKNINLKSNSKEIKEKPASIDYNVVYLERYEQNKKRKEENTAKLII